jgi:hypothetical protein
VETRPPNGQTHSKVICGQFAFPIPKALDLKHGDKVLVQFYLSETDHPMKSAGRARTTDPASRLAILLSGHNCCGTFHIWFMSKTGERVVFKMNVLVDILEGYHLTRDGHLQDCGSIRRSLLRAGIRQNNVYLVGGNSSICPDFRYEPVCEFCEPSLGCTIWRGLCSAKLEPEVKLLLINLLVRLPFVNGNSNAMVIFSCPCLG